MRYPIVNIVRNSRMSGLLEDYQAENNRFRELMQREHQRQQAQQEASRTGQQVYHPPQYPPAPPQLPPPPPLTEGGTPPLAPPITVSPEGELPPTATTVGPFKPGGGRPSTVTGGTPGEPAEPPILPPPPPGPPPQSGKPVATPSASSLREIECYSCGGAAQFMTRFDAEQRGCAKVPEYLCQPKPPAVATGVSTTAMRNVPAITESPATSVPFGGEPPPQQPAEVATPGAGGGNACYSCGGQVSWGPGGPGCYPTGYSEETCRSFARGGDVASVAAGAGAGMVSPVALNPMATGAAAFGGSLMGRVRLVPSPFGFGAPRHAHPIRMAGGWR